jgi:16S rRNA (uracil1498-N3)-methyltransferase
MASVRLFVDAPLSAGAAVAASPGQSHYLAAVMRRRPGDEVRLFNGRDGEWQGRIASLERGHAQLAVEECIRPQTPGSDLWLVFAMLKRDATDTVVQKATELGVSAICPVQAERSVSLRTNQDRLRAIAIEAAEQSERLTLPDIAPPRPLSQILADWRSPRTLFTAVERLEAPGIPLTRGPAALLVGPEGGFTPRELDLLRQCPFVTMVSLGPFVLRADTACIAGLAVLQASSHPPLRPWGAGAYR